MAQSLGGGRRRLYRVRDEWQTRDGLVRQRRDKGRLRGGRRFGGWRRRLRGGRRRWRLLGRRRRGRRLVRGGRSLLGHGPGLRRARLLRRRFRGWGWRSGGGGRRRHRGGYGRGGRRRTWRALVAHH